MARLRQSFCTVLVVDPHPMAHVPFIHAATLGCLTSLGVRCVSLSVQREAIEDELGGLQQRLEIPGARADLVGWGDLPVGAGSSWKALEDALAPWMQQQGDEDSTLIWIGWLDYLIGRSRKSPRLPSWPWHWAGAFYLLPPPFLAGPRWTREWCKERLLPFWRFCASERCHGVAVLDEFWLQDAQESLINRWFRPCRRKLLRFPDVASTHAEPSGPFPTGTDGTIRIGLFGQLSWRKGLVPFLHAACVAEQSNPQLEFLLGGELQLQHFSEADQREILAILRNPPGNLRYWSEPIKSEVSFNALVQQADVIHVAYHHFTGSSNLLTKAARYRIPVIANPGHLIGRRVQDFSLGWLTAAETEQAYLDVVLRLNLQKIKQARNEGRWEDCWAEHDLTRLRSMFEQALSLGRLNKMHRSALEK